MARTSARRLSQSGRAGRGTNSDDAARRGGRAEARGSVFFGRARDGDRRARQATRTPRPPRKTSKLEADLSEARDAQERASGLEAELNAARDRIATLEAQVNAPTGDADADALRQKVASLETKVAANDKAMAEAGKRFKQLKEKAKRRVEEESAKLKPLQAENDELRARLSDKTRPCRTIQSEGPGEGGQGPQEAAPRGAETLRVASGDERVRELEQELEWAREDKGGEAELLREELAEAKKKAHAAQTQRAAEVERLEERCRALEQQNSQQGQSLVSLRGDVAKITDSERANATTWKRRLRA